MSLSGAWYNSSDANGPGDAGPASGAYIFRPNGVFEATGPLPTTSIRGPVVTEVHQVRSMPQGKPLYMPIGYQDAEALLLGLQAPEGIRL